MAPGTFQEAFYVAVQNGREEEWHLLLSESRKDPSISLDLNVCLLDAVRLSCPAAVKDVLRWRPSLNSEDSDGQRAIHLAAKFGPPESIQLLARAGSTLNCSNKEGWSPLHIACQFQKLSNVEMLMSLGANKNSARTEDQLTPLHVAVQNPCEEIVSLLLCEGADPNARSSRRHGQLSALAMAVMGEDMDVLKAVFQSTCLDLEIDYTTDVDGNYPLHLAVEHGNIESCHLLLSHLQCVKLVESYDNRGASRTFQGSFSHLKNQVDKRRQILLNLTDRNERTALHLALLKNRRDMVLMLLDAGVDVQITYADMLPFELATRCIQPLDGCCPLAMESPERSRKLAEGIQWDDAIVRLLLEHSINLETVTKKREYPIHLVLSAGLYDVALLIIAKTPHLINHADATGETPLHIACKRKSVDHCVRLELISKLLEMGLSVNAITNDRACPLAFAVRDGDIEVVSILLACSPDMSITDERGFAPFHYAVSSQNIAVLDAMLAARPDIISFEGFVFSPLRLAVTEKNMKMVDYLLQRNADPNHMDSANENSLLHTAISLFACTPSSKEYLEIIELLVKSGADLDARGRYDLTPLQSMMQVLLCCSMLPRGRELAMGPGLLALKLLVEAGCQLCPWTLTEAGVTRRTPLQNMAYCGLLPLVYYLANVGWPLATEIPSSSAASTASGGNQAVSDQPDWMRLPGNTPAQDNLHAFLMLRNANPFSLLHLARTVVRNTLTEASIKTYGGQRREILTWIEKLPVPHLIKKYVYFQDWDYSSTEESWKKLLHLLPSSAEDEALKAVMTS